MTPLEIREMLIAHDRAITQIQTYFKVMIGFGVLTMPFLIYTVIKLTIR